MPSALLSKSSASPARRSSPALRRNPNRNSPVKPHLLISAVALALLIAACGGASEEVEHGHDENGEPAADEIAKGEHSGRMLEQDDYAIELGIAEEGTPPKFQAWLYQGRKPLPA